MRDHDHNDMSPNIVTEVTQHVRAVIRLADQTIASELSFSENIDRLELVDSRVLSAQMVTQTRERFVIKSKERQVSIVNVKTRLETFLNSENLLAALDAAKDALTILGKCTADASADFEVINKLLDESAQRKRKQEKRAKLAFLLLLVLVASFFIGLLTARIDNQPVRFVAIFFWELTTVVTAIWLSHNLLDKKTVEHQSSK